MNLSERAENRKLLNPMRAALPECRASGSCTPATSPCSRANACPEGSRPAPRPAEAPETGDSGCVSSEATIHRIPVTRVRSGNAQGGDSAQERIRAIPVPAGAIPLNWLTTKQSVEQSGSGRPDHTGRFERLLPSRRRPSVTVPFVTLVGSAGQRQRGDPRWRTIEELPFRLLPPSEGCGGMRSKVQLVVLILTAFCAGRGVEPAEKPGAAGWRRGENTPYPTDKTGGISIEVGVAGFDSRRLHQLGC